MTDTATQEVPVFTDVTPSGLEIEYVPHPRRYRLRKPVRLPESSGAGGDVHPLDESEWVEVPSVSAVLGVLEKKGLPWWGQRIGIEGVLALFNAGMLRPLYEVGAQTGDRAHLTVNTTEGYVQANPDQIVELLTKQKLTVNHVRDRAGDRGTAVHDALEVWAKDGTKPDPEMFPHEERGYVVGLLAFLNDVPSAEPVAAEVMVGSLEHGFAGRYDIRFRTTKEHAVVVHRTPVKGPQFAKLLPGLYLGDLKTSKSLYRESHWRQLEGYEGASVECGYEPTDGRGILLVGADGSYRFGRSKATYEDFLTVLAVYRSNERIKSA